MMLRKTKRKLSTAVIETLEDRQLMSLTMDVRAVSVTGTGVTLVNNKSITVTSASVGGTVNFEVHYKVAGTNAVFTDDGLQSGTFRLRSTAGSVGNAIRGNMNNTNAAGTLGPVAPFDSLGASTGSLADLDTDTDLDIGGTNLNTSTNMASIRSGSITFGTTSASLDFLVYRFSMSISAVIGTTSFSETDIQLQRRVTTSATAWVEDGVAKSPGSGIAGYGNPVVIKVAGKTSSGATVTGSVYNDADLSATRTLAEEGLPGWKIFDDVNNNSIADATEKSVTTDALGNYVLTGLSAALHHVRAVKQTGYGFISPSTGLFDTTLTATQIATGRHFAVTTSALISGNVFNDANNNKVKDATEANLGGWTVYLDNNKNGILDTGDVNAVTDASGNYSFRVAPGTYDVRLFLKSGYLITTPSTDFYTAQTVAVAQKATGRNFGAIVGTQTTNSSVAGVVYVDANANGVKDAAEAGLAGWTLFNDTNLNGILDATEPSIITDGTGNYSFTAQSNAFHRYKLILPTGFAYATPSTGVRDFKLLSAQALTGQNFGVKSISTTTGIVAGSIFDDTNTNGLQGAGEVGVAGRVVFDDVNKNGLLDAGEINTTSTATGAYYLTGLSAGAHRIAVTAKAGVRFTNPVSGRYDVTLIAGQILGAQHFATTYHALISGNVFNDLNSNTIKDTGELGLSAWTVFIDFNSNGVLDALDKTTTTDSLGNFSFSSVSGGTWSIGVVLKAGFTQTTPLSIFNTVSVVDAQTLGGVLFGEK